MRKEERGLLLVLPNSLSLNVLLGIIGNRPNLSFRYDDVLEKKQLFSHALTGVAINVSILLNSIRLSHRVPQNVQAEAL